MKPNLFACCGLLLSFIVGWPAVSRADVGVIHQFEQTLATGCWVDGAFTQEKSIQGLPILLRSSGKFLLDCQRGGIWLQHKPAFEGFLFDPSGDHLRLGAGGKLAPIEARYQSFIGRLILMLVTNESAEIEKLFTVELANQQPLSFELKPRQRRLQRAVRSLFIVQLPITEQGHKQVEITLVDGANQTLRIVNTEHASHRDSAGLMARCLPLLGVDARAACARLAAVTPGSTRKPVL